MSPEAYVPCMLALSLIQLEWAIMPFLSGFTFLLIFMFVLVCLIHSEEAVFWGMAWDSVLICILTTLLVIALAVRRYLS